MRPNGDIGLADLIKATIRLNLGAEDQLRVGRLLGLVPEVGSEQPEANTSSAQEPQGPSADEAPHKTPVDGAEQTDPAMPDEPEAPDTVRLLKLADHVPAWLDGVEPMPRAKPEDYRPAPPDPIFPDHWRTTYALATILGTADPHGPLDIDAAVGIIASAHPIKDVPRRRWRTLRRGVHILQDLTPGLEPFRLDLPMLHRQIRAAVGHDRVEVHWVLGRHVVKAARDEAAAAELMPPPGTPVVVVTDLGVHMAGVLPEAWRCLLDRLGRNGSAVTVISPYTRERLPVGTPEDTVLLPWTDTPPDQPPAVLRIGRQTAAIAKSGSEEPARRSALRLAQAASPAILVQPWLLRRLRRELLPGSGPMVERDVWFSSWVATRDHTGIEFEQEAQKDLRQKLKSDPEMLRKVEKVFADPRRKGLPSFKLEEGVVLRALAGASSEELNELLKPALAALVDPSQSNLDVWAEQALTEMPETMRSTEVYGLMAARIFKGASDRDGEVQATDVARKLAARLPPDLPGPSSVREYDVFVSFARADRQQVRLFVDALQAVGLRVWSDDMPLLRPLQEQTLDALQSSRLFLAFYSKAYATSNRCNDELAAAYIGGGPERIVIINPESDHTHVEPKTLLSALSASGTTEPMEMAERIRGVVKGFGAGFSGSVQPPRDQLWFGIPRRQDFVGRSKELWDLHGKLSQLGNVVLSSTFESPSDDGVASILGVGGAGKSRLAIEYARRFAAAYPAGIIFLRSRGSDRVGQLRALADQLGADRAGDPKGVEDSIRAALEKREGTYLWIVDDLAGGLEQAEARQWFAPTRSGRTLVTTRDATFQSPAHGVQLSHLDGRAGLELLTSQRSPDSPEEAEAAVEIVEALGGLPLAIDLARHWISTKGYIGLLKLLAVRNPEEADVALRMRDELPVESASGIANVFLEAFRALSDSAKEVLDAAAVLAPSQPIPLHFMVQVLLCNERHLEQAVHELAAASLCQLHDNGFAIHALVCRIVALRQDSGRQAELRLQLVRVLADTLSVAADIRQHRRLAGLVGHAEHLARRPETLAEAELIGYVGDYHFAAGAYALAEAALRSSMTVKRTFLGVDAPETLAAGNALSNALLSLGQFEKARAMAENSFSRSKGLGSDHPDALSSMNNLAAILRAQGDHAGARELHEQTLEARRRVLGAEHPDTLTSMNNLAMTLGAQGDHAGARALQEQALKAQRRIRGEEHPDTLTSMNNLAMTLGAQGDHAGARALQEQALKAQRRILGAEHPDTLTSMNNLASALWALGDRDGARALQEQALEALHRVWGTEHPVTIAAMGKLAQVALLDGNYKSTRSFTEQAWEGRPTSAVEPPHATEGSEGNRPAPAALNAVEGIGSRRSERTSANLDIAVILIHAHRDEARASALTDLLGRQGFQIINTAAHSERITADDFVAGRMLADKLRWAGAAIVLVTPQTQYSTWVEWEIRHVNRIGKPIIGVWDKGGAAGRDVPDALTMFGRAMVGWDAQQILDAINGKTDCWLDPNGITIPPRKIKRHCVG